MDKVRSRHRWPLGGTSKVCEPLGLARKPCLEELAGVFASSGDGMNLKFNLSSTDFRVPAETSHRELPIPDSALCESDCLSHCNHNEAS